MNLNFRQGASAAGSTLCSQMLPLLQTLQTTLQQGQVRLEMRLQRKTSVQVAYSQSDCFTLRAAVTALAVVSGCGVIIEVRPYLEVLCVPDETSKGIATEERSCAATTPQDHENQGSLITLAWAKPFQESGDQGAEVTEITQDSVEMPFQSRHASSRGQHGQFEDTDDVEPTLVRSDSTGHPERLRVNEQRLTSPQVTSASSRITVILHPI